MVITQDENCHNHGVARPPIRDNDLKRKFETLFGLKVFRFK